MHRSGRDYADPFPSSSPSRFFNSEEFKTGHPPPGNHSLYKKLYNRLLTFLLGIYFSLKYIEYKYICNCTTQLQSMHDDTAFVWENIVIVHVAIILHNVCKGWAAGFHNNIFLNR